MSRHFDAELKELKAELLKMGNYTEEAIFKSVEALTARDAAMARSVMQNDVIIDRLELAIDEKCVDLIACFQPVAKDLRFITTGLKINAELERIADIASDIAVRTLELVDKPLLKPLIDIPRLAEVARTMVRLSIEGFVDNDIEKAQKVLAAEPEADMLRNRVQKELIEDYMTKDASSAPRAVQLLLIARFLERICDHATNIAEDIIYMVQAKVVKHLPKK